jgi:NADP-dependent 3-hydroxy acid dehydrogenase YdfG
MSQTALIAGVGETIGEATARTLHDAGYDVGLFARSEPFIEDLAADLGDGALAVPTDITDTDAVTAGVEQVLDTVVRDSLPPWLVKTRFSKPLTPKYVPRSRN